MIVAISRRVCAGVVCVLGVLAVALISLHCAGPANAAAQKDYGKLGEPVKLVVGYQPYYTESWSGVIMRGKKFYEKYLPKGSTVDFQIGLQGAIIVNNLLAGKQHIGYMGDMPAIVSTTKQDVRRRSPGRRRRHGLGPVQHLPGAHRRAEFANDQEAIKWLDGKTVAVPKGSCTDRFAQAVFKRRASQPSEYLNQNIEVITSNFRAGKLDAAVMWEPTTSRLVLEASRARSPAAPRSTRTTPAFWACAPSDQAAARRRQGVAQRRARRAAVLRRSEERDGSHQDGAEQTTGFSEHALWMAAYGTYPEARRRDVRIILPYAFTPDAMELIKRASAFLFEIKSINAELRPEAVMAEFAPV